MNELKFQMTNEFKYYQQQNNKGEFKSRNIKDRHFCYVVRQIQLSSNLTNYLLVY